MRTILESLERHTTDGPERTLFTFLDDDGSERETHTWRTFEERTRLLAAHLAGSLELRRGDRALLVHPPGLEFIAAFMACARLGVVSVPACPPASRSARPGLDRLRHIARDSGARVVLTTAGLLEGNGGGAHAGAPGRSPMPGIPSLPRVSTDLIQGPAPGHFHDDPGPVLFLQYTSGSTSEPRGVVVSHDNVIHNCRSTVDHVPVGVCWLPQYHDMGLIGYYLFTLVAGGMTAGFSPMAFLRKPALWLRAIHRVRATCTSAPNFAFEYCLREDRLPDAELEGLDLGSLRVMMNAAEPVRAGTFARFLERFAPYGLRPEAHVAAYGLAENTLCVSHRGRRILTVNKRLLQERSLYVEDPRPANNNQLRLVSCGRPLDGIDVRIADPDTGAPLPADRVGEVRVSGPSTCRGYWNRPDLSRMVFGKGDGGGTGGSSDPSGGNGSRGGNGAHHGGDGNGAGELRTGDLGFLHEGELYICGRLKDVIIVHGVNYYPQDIESIAETACPGIRPEATAAFDVDGEDGGLVVVTEVEREDALPDPARIARAIRARYFIEPRAVVLAPRRAVAKTTSGKVSRSLTRDRWLAGTLPVLAVHHPADRPEPEAGSNGLRSRFRYLFDFEADGDAGSHTFAELGVDSLTMARLHEDVRALLAAKGADGALHEADLRFIQEMTIAEFFSVLDRLDEEPAAPLPALTGFLRRSGEDHARREDERMRLDAAIDPGRFRTRPAGGPLREILLTGATGFFGPFLLTALLRRTDGVVHAMVRAADAGEGRARLDAAIRRAGLRTAALDALLGERVRVVAGDLEAPALGLSREAWNALAERVDAVVHNGARVNYVRNYDTLRAANVLGTLELLRLAAAGAPKEFHLVSSTFIFGWTPKPELHETDGNEEMRHLDFGYSQTKWVAERLVFAARDRGLAARVYRPSLLSPSTAGHGGRDDVAVRLLAFMLRHGIAVEAENQVSFLPVDIAAANLAAIVADRTAPEGPYHLTVDEYRSFTDVARAIERDHGARFVYHDIPSFVAEMNRLCAPDEPLYPLLDFFNRSHPKIAAMRHKRYRNDRYRAARAQAGGRPDAGFAETVSWIMAFLRREGLAPAEPGGPAPVLPRGRSTRA